MAESARSFSMPVVNVVDVARLFVRLFSLPTKTHFRVGLVVVRPGVREGGRSGASEGHRREQRAADKGGENHQRVFFRFFFFDEKAQKK